MILAKTKTISRISTLIICFVCLIISACERTSSRAEYSNPDKPIEINADREFALNLTSNPSTGYEWRLSEISEENVVNLVTNIYTPETTAQDIVGSGGHERWVFRAVGAGKTKITMQYIRPWEKDVPPIQTNVFTVIVK